MSKYMFHSYDGDPGVLVEEFSDDEELTLKDYVTNTDTNVFAWKLSKDMGLEQTGALLSRYSRTALNGRRLFLKEFYPNKDRGREFFDAWLVDYGDDSIQEMIGGLPAACEFVSNVAVKEIEDCRTGSYIEKSTRYVAFDKRLSDHEFMFFKDPDIMGSRYGDEYLDLMRELFASYSNYIDAMSKYLKDKNPVETIKFRIGNNVIGINELGKGIADESGVREEDLLSAYNNAIKANALDFLRDYLPMSTLTHVGISMDGRSYENLLNKLLSSQLSEARFIGQRLNSELSKITPSLLKRVNDAHGQTFQKFISERNANTKEQASKIIGDLFDKGESVELVEYKGQDSKEPDSAAQIALCSAILYKFSNGASIRQLQKKAAEMPVDKRNNLINTYVGKRTNRRHKPGRAFENIEYLFDLKGRIGIYRDIQRHRIGTQERQNFGTELGYETRKEFYDIDIADDYKSKMERASDLYMNLKKILPYQAQYAVAFGFNARWYYRLNARQLYHLCELRSSQQGHPDYRILVQNMAMKVKHVHPTIISNMNYLDMSEKVLGRLDSEVRIAVKRKEISQGQLKPKT